MVRRGQMIGLEQFAAMGLAIAVIFIFLFFISERTDSRGYFMELQGKDMALLSDIVIGSPGNIVVLYDNVKQGLDIKYEFQKNTVRTGSGAKAYSFGIYEGMEPFIGSFTPSFLTFIKKEDAFLVKQAVAYSVQCAGERTVRKLSFDLEAQDKNALQGSAHKVLSHAMREAPELNDEDGIRISVQSGEPLITYGGADGELLGCLLGSMYESLSGDEIVVKESGDEIVIFTDESDEFMGFVIAQAVVVYAR